jgi:hypothetical protein
MGNFSSNSNKSSEKEFKNFYDVMDYIATYYILTMDFKSLSKLSEKPYCDKLVVLTSDIIQRYFNDIEITYLAQRIKDGVEINEQTKENLIFINKDNLEGLDISNDFQKNIKKKRVCNGIAKFYVKIAHIFAAIVMTINPVYTYKDETGQTVKTKFLEKDSIPKNVDRKLFKYNICDNRIRALKKGEKFDELTGNVSIQPKVCDINIDKNGLNKTLSDEPGITELLKLYLDDSYDYSSANFTGMTNTTKRQFIKDLKLFYTAFTGNANMPPEITKFSDIKLKDYNKQNGCQGSSPILKNKITLNKKDKLFVDYAENTKKMIQTAADNQSKLLSVINELFTYIIDPYTNKKVIRVNPKLTEEKLQKTVEKTRHLIVNLYIKCENDYVNGVKLFEAIVETKIFETTNNQIETLKNEAKQIINDTKQMFVPLNNEPPNFVLRAETNGNNKPQPYDSESEPESDLESEFETNINPHFEEHPLKIPLQNFEEQQIQEKPTINLSPQIQPEPIILPPPQIQPEPIILPEQPINLPPQIQPEPIILPEQPINLPPQIQPEPINLQPQIQPEQPINLQPQIQPEQPINLPPQIQPELINLQPQIQQEQPIILPKQPTTTTQIV